jgi:hypothetical protein
MTEAELRGTVRDVNDEIRRLIHSQQVRADIHRQIEARNRRPLEEDFIDADLRDETIGVPTIREIEGVRVRVWKLHRRGASASDIRGADLMYEIEGEKFVLIQYKTPAANGSVSADVDQLGVLQNSCALACPPPPMPNRGCGGWQAIRNQDGLYLPACMAREIFGTRASRDQGAFVSGLSKQQFDAAFAQCAIGSSVRLGGPRPSIELSLANGHLVVFVTQEGRF